MEDEEKLTIDEYQYENLKRLLKDFGLTFSKFLSLIELLFNFKSYDEILDFIDVNGEKENEQKQ